MSADPSEPAVPPDAVPPDTARPEAAADTPAFRLRPGSVIRAGWLETDLMFQTRSLRFLLHPQGAALRRSVGLEAGEIGILAVVGLNPGVSQNDLAASVVLKKSAVTRLVQDLERRGLLLRTRNATDRRANCLTLTPEGESVVRRIRKATRARQDDWFAGIDPDERAMFLSVMARLIARLAESAPPGDGADAGD